jgi:hypothetical protein
MNAPTNDPSPETTSPDKLPRQGGIVGLGMRVGAIAALAIFWVLLSARSAS